MPHLDEDSKRLSASSSCSPHAPVASSLGTGTSQPSASASLAHVAAAAVGQATPCAYVPLVARVKYLEDENRRLRKQLNQARSVCHGCRGYMEKPSRVQSSTPCARGRARSSVGGRAVGSKHQARGPFAGDRCASVSSTGAPVPAPAPSVCEDWQALTGSSSAGRIPARHRPPFRSPTLLESMAATELRAGQSEVLTASPKDWSRGCTPSPRSELLGACRSELPMASPRELARSVDSTPRRASPPKSRRSSFAASAPVGHTSFGRSSPSTPPPPPIASRQPRVRTPPGGNSKSSGVIAPLGPPPPEDDTEGFLRYLDAFQERAGRLCETPLEQTAQVR